MDCYKQMPDVEIVAGADLIPGKAEAFFKRFGVEGVRCYPSHKEMLDAEQLDAVSICTYNATHAECAIYALNKGVNVLLEKPMSVTTEEAVDIMKAEKKSGKILSIGFQPRLDANMQMIKKIVDTGVLGKIYYIQTGGGRRRGIPNSTFIEKKTAGIGALGRYRLLFPGYGAQRHRLSEAVDGDRVTPPTISAPAPSTTIRRTPPVLTWTISPRRLSVWRAILSSISGFPGRCTSIPPVTRLFWGRRGLCSIPSTDCWNGSVGGPMTLYHDVAGQQTETVHSDHPQQPGVGWTVLPRRSVPSWMPSRTATPLPFPPARSCTIRPLLTASSSPRKKAGKLRFRFPPSIERTASVLLWTHPGFSIAASSL